MAGIGVLRTIEGGLLGFHCPGCRHMHAVGVAPPATLIWGWNGDYERPTFTPSILVTSKRGDPPVTPENFEEYRRAPWPQTKIDWVCHSFVTDGRIQFLGDCTHELRGQTIELQREDDMRYEEEQGQEGANNPGGANTESQPASLAQETAAAPAVEAGDASAALPASDPIPDAPQQFANSVNPAELLAQVSAKAVAANAEQVSNPELVKTSIAGAGDGENGVGSDVPNGESLASTEHPETLDSGNLSAGAIEDIELKSPMHGTETGDILDKIREGVNKFEHAAATEAHAVAAEIRKEIVGLVSKLKSEQSAPPNGTRRADLISGMREELVRIEDAFADNDADKASGSHQALYSMVQELGNFVRRRV